MSAQAVGQLLFKGDCSCCQYQHHFK